MNGWYRIKGAGVDMKIEIVDGKVKTIMGMWMNVLGLTIDAVLDMVVKNEWTIERTGA